MHHVGSFYILTYDARKLKHKMHINISSPSVPRASELSFSCRFPPLLLKNCMRFFSPPHICHIPHPSLCLGLMSSSDHSAPHFTLASSQLFTPTLVGQVSFSAPYSRTSSTSKEITRSSILQLQIDLLHISILIGSSSEEIQVEMLR